MKSVRYDKILLARQRMEDGNNQIDLEMRTETKWDGMDIEVMLSKKEEYVCMRVCMRVSTRVNYICTVYCILHDRNKSSIHSFIQYLQVKFRLKNQIHIQSQDLDLKLFRPKYLYRIVSYRTASA